MKYMPKFIITLLLLFVSFISVADLIFRPGHPITFDGHIHMTTMNQFAQSLYDKEFPVTWANNFANYGHPLGIIAHQLPAYLGAIGILMGASTELSFIVLIFLSITVSSFLFYVFFRKFADEKVSFTAAALSVFFPYRALNIYVRGGLPEIMATIFLPVFLLGVWYTAEKKYQKAGVLLYIATLGTALSHPMMLLVFSIPVGVYFLSTLTKKTLRKTLIVAVASVFLGLLSASYYLIPLFSELKYFYQSQAISTFVDDSFLTVKQLYDPAWFYTLTHPGPRGNYIKLGTIEFGILLSSIVLLSTSYLLKNKTTLKKYVSEKHTRSLLLWTLTSTILVLLLLPISSFIYTLPFFESVQYPWRFLAGLQITIPLVFIFLIKSVKKLNNAYFLLFCIAVLLWYRVPEFYGKNYITQPESDYYFNQANLHSTNFNTIWSANSQSYEQKETQAKIIEGTGELTVISEKNASRRYTTNSTQELRLLDYTFYFPGWSVYVDSQPISIEYQDSNYRGLITYTVPAGSHEVIVVYEYTKTRLLAAVLSVLGISLAGLLYLFLSSKYLKSN